jgi:hypothetical protein
MKQTIAIKIDATKLDKQRFFKGKKGTYIDLVAFVDLDQSDQYGNNGFIKQQLSQEERQSGVDVPICGNVKLLSGGRKYERSAPQSAPQADFDDFDDADIPF